MFSVRGLRVGNPDLGIKPLLDKLREQQPDLEAGTREVRNALNVLKTEAEANVNAFVDAAGEVVTLLETTTVPGQP